MGILIDGRAIAQKINEKILAESRELRKKGIIPSLVVILVGDDPASVLYVHKKEEAAKNLMIEFGFYHLPKNISEAELKLKIKQIQSDKNPSGLIVQLPLSKHLDPSAIIDEIDPDRDVDCLTATNLGKLLRGDYHIEPPTAGAIMEVLKSKKISISGKNITIVGTGILVGKPLAAMMMSGKASVTTCNQSTKNLKDMCRQADILVSGAGKANLIGADMVKNGAMVIDVGTSFVNGKIRGDVNTEEVLDVAGFITPTPGGVGPITVSKLLSNTVACAGLKK